MVVPALAQGQARAADVYHVVQVVGDLVDLAVGVAITKRLEFEFWVVDQFLNSAVFLTTTHCVLLPAD